MLIDVKAVTNSHLLQPKGASAAVVTCQNAVESVA